MSDARRADRLLDAALTVLNRVGTHTREGDTKVVSAKSGRIDLSMRGLVEPVTAQTGVLPGAGSKRRDTAVGRTASYLLEVRAPVSVFTVSWGGGGSIEVHHLIGGDWERELLDDASAEGPYG